MPTPGVRDPGALPNVLARVDGARRFLTNPDLSPGVKEIIEGLLALAKTQHELNKRLWEAKKGLPEPHADSHIWGDDSIGGSLGGKGLANVAQRTVTFSVTLGANDQLVRGNASAGPITVTLPSAADRPARVVSVAKVDSTKNAVTVAPQSTDTLAGDATSFDLVLESEVLSLMSNGSDWTVI